MKDVVTISRQLGSMGFEVAQIISSQKGYQLIWRELLNEAAIRSGVPEAALEMIDELGLLGITSSPPQRKAYLQAIQQVMEEIADGGRVVFVGRAGQIMLKGNPRVFHVRIVAPLEIRAERIANRSMVPYESALAQVQASDQSRKRFISKAYHANWEDPLLYHLTINTAELTPEQTAALICPVLA